MRLAFVMLAMCIASPDSAAWEGNGLDLEPDDEGACLVQTGANLLSQNQPRTAELDKLLVLDEELLDRSDQPNGTSSNLTDLASANTTSASIPQKNKVVLLIIELIPPLGCLGVDRLYLGSIITGCIKLGVCICTCFIGGAIWGIIDGILILINALSKETSIDKLGMVAEFDESQVDTAQTLGWVMLGLWGLFGLFACLFHRTRYPNYVTSLADSRASGAAAAAPRQ